MVCFAAMAQVGQGAQITGQVRVNGEATPLSALRYAVGFVPQDDIVHEDLTVRWAVRAGTRGCALVHAGRQRRVKQGVFACTALAK